MLCWLWCKYGAPEQSDCVHKQSMCRSIFWHWDTCTSQTRKRSRTVLSEPLNRPSKCYLAGSKLSSHKYLLKMFLYEIVPDSSPEQTTFTQITIAIVIVTSDITGKCNRTKIKQNIGNCYQKKVKTMQELTRKNIVVIHILKTPFFSNLFQQPNTYKVENERIPFLCLVQSF